MTAVRFGIVEQTCPVLYNAVSVSELLLPFHEDDITMHDLTFKGLSSETRDEGDKIGVLIEQVQEAG